MADWSLRNWDFRKAWVGYSTPDEFLQRFINSESCAIAAARSPVFGENDDIDDITLVGLVQNFGFRQGQQVARLFEMGSRGNLLVGGRGAGSIGIARVLFNGPSLMKALYPDVTDDEALSFYRQPGIGNAFMNLQSELFNRAHGLFFLMFDQLNQFYSTLFFEVCMINSHGLSIAPNANLTAENVGILYQDIYSVDPGLVQPAA